MVVASYHLIRVAGACHPVVAVVSCPYLPVVEFVAVGREILVASDWEIG